MPIVAVQKSVEAKTRIDVVEYGEYYFSQDKILGHLIVAQCLGSHAGGEVYKIPSFKGDAEQLSGKEMRALLDDRMLYTKLLPWLGVKMVTHTDEGSPALIAMRHMPSEIVLFKSSPEEIEDWD